MVFPGPGCARCAVGRRRGGNPGAILEWAIRGLVPCCVLWLPGCRGQYSSSAADGARPAHSTRLLPAPARLHRVRGPLLALFMHAAPAARSLALCCWWAAGGLPGAQGARVPAAARAPRPRGPYIANRNCTAALLALMFGGVHYGRALKRARWRWLRRLACGPPRLPRPASCPATWRHAGCTLVLHCSRKRPPCAERRSPGGMPMLPTGPGLAGRAG